MADGLCVCVCVSVSGRVKGGMSSLCLRACIFLICVRALQLDASCPSCRSSPDILPAVFIQSAGSSFHLHTDTHGERIPFPCDVIDSELHGNSERGSKRGEGEGKRTDIPSQRMRG